MTDYALEFIDGHLRPPRRDQTTWVSTAHGIQELVKVRPMQAGAVHARAEDVSVTITALKAKMPRAARAAAGAQDSQRDAGLHRRCARFRGLLPSPRSRGGASDDRPLRR